MKVVQFLLLNKFALCSNPRFLSNFQIPGGNKISRGSNFFTTPVLANATGNVLFVCTARSTPFTPSFMTSACRVGGFLRWFFFFASGTGGGVAADVPIVVLSAPATANAVPSYGRPTDDVRHVSFV
jgi:hypothetical protein